MRIGVFFFGAVEFEGPLGVDGPAPLDRRVTPGQVWRATERLLDVGATADHLGYDAFWLTEHHFQHEGYEVIPNGLLLGAFLAARTRRISIGTMFNVVAQWHPLRLAEDFATLHNLSGGRAVLGVGRGTVPREMLPLSFGRTSVGSSDNPDQAAADALNREVTEEGIDLLLTALRQERFCHRGRHFQAPPAGIPDRGGEVRDLTLLPSPRFPFDVWQPTTSPATLAAVARRDTGAVFWLQHEDLLRRGWETYQQHWEQAHGSVLAPGARRMLVVNTHIADSHEQAVAQARPGHDEFWKFLGPYGWGRGYRSADGAPMPAGWVPTLADSMAQRTWVVGTAQEVAAGLAALRDALDLQDLTIFPSMPGESYDVAEEQLERFAAEVRPLLDPPGRPRSAGSAEPAPALLARQPVGAS